MVSLVYTLMASIEPVNRLQPTAPEGRTDQEQQQGPDMSHLAERFAEAVRTLVSDGPIKQRLSRAYAEHLDGLDHTGLPAGLRRDFGELEAALSRIAPVGNETRVRANVQKMSVSEAGRHATTIVNLYVELMSQAGRAEPLKVVTTAKKTPRYLATRS
jgi:hypothetical protein